ncbi:MAG: arylsulfatase A-like enzyme [Cognaticolwellia sp.]|jgi:arylsulfatase A-like enzyme
MTKKVGVWLSVGALILGGGGAAVQEASAEQAVLGSPNVVVIILDTQRPDHLGLDDSAPQNSPWLKSLAERGVRFDQAKSTSSWTIPSMASVATGQYPNRHAVVDGAVPRRNAVAEQGLQLTPLPSIDLQTKTLAQRFRNAGYATIGVNTNTLMMRHQGFERGFENFRKFTPAEYEPDSEKRTPNPKALSSWAMEDRGQAPADASRVVGWVKEQEALLHGDKPFFLWVHLTDSHQPYHRRAPYFEESSDPLQEMSNAYDSELHYADKWLSTLVQDMALEENTYIVVLSDHGDAFGEHGVYGHGSDSQLYREVNDAVLLIAGPGIVAGQSPKFPVSLVDVYPTLLGLVGIGDNAQVLDGVDLSPVLRGEPGAKALRSRLRERPIFAIRSSLKGPRSGTWMVLKKNWKLMERRDGAELFNLRADPSEKSSLHGQAPAGVQSELEALLEEHRANARIQVPQTESIQVDPNTVEALRAMGYIE